MTYEETKRSHPAVANFGRPLWPATHTFPPQPGGTRLSLTPLVVSQDGQVEATAYLAVETDSADCRYWIFAPAAPDSLGGVSDRDGETVDGLSTCYQDCLGCPPPCGPPPTMLDKFNCLIGCLLGLGGWEPFSGTINYDGGGWQIFFGGSTPTGGFTNQPFLHNGTGNGNNTGSNNGGGGNGGLSTYNFTQTAYNVFDKYYECLQEHPEISTAVWNKLYTPNGTLHCLSPFIDEALGMLCGEAEGQHMTVAQFEEEFARAIAHFYGIARNVEGYVFPACGLVGDVINFALEHHLTSEQFAALSLTDLLRLVQNAVESGTISPETGKRILDAALAFGATVDQVNFLIQLAQQNPSADFLEILIVNFGIEESPNNPVNPPISTTKPACSALFNFFTGPDESPGAPAPNSPGIPWKTAAALLSDIYVEFNYQGTKMLYRIMNIGFTVSNKGVDTFCLDKSDDYAVGILNTTVSATQTTVNQYPPGLSQQEFNERVKLDIQRKLIEAVDGATAEVTCEGPGNRKYKLGAEMNGLPLAFKSYYGCESTSCDVKMADCP